MQTYESFQQNFPLNIQEFGEQAQLKIEEQESKSKSKNLKRRQQKKKKKLLEK